MIARAEAKFIRISPFKVRPVIQVVKAFAASRAMSVLTAMNKKGAYHLAKVLKSAIANAKQKGYSEDKLFIAKAIANSGPTLKRFRAASFGRATPILKRSSHITVELDTTEKIIEKPKVK